jgi:uncharacterized protein Yka (UPF0111/DUF47 family)
MEQIPDAPWIREAEMYGAPPYDDRLDDAIDYLEDAAEAISTAINQLEEANYELYEHDQHDSLIETTKLEDVFDEIRNVIRKYRL